MFFTCVFFLVTLAHSAPFSLPQLAIDAATLKLIATSNTDADTSWSVSHTATGSGTGLIALHSGMENSPATTQLVDSKLIIDGYELVLLPEMAQVRTYTNDKSGGGGGSAAFSMTEDGAIAVAGGVEGFWACPSIIVSSNEQVGGPECASIPTPCADEGSFTLWFGRDVKERSLPVKSCQSVKLHVS